MRRVVFLALLLAGCADEEAAPGARLLAFCSRYEDELCGWYGRCRADASFGGSCEEVLDLGPSCSRALGRIDDGRVEFVPDAAAACLESARASNESCTWEEWEGCDRFLRGLVPTGGACAENGDCAEGWCNVGAECPGRCEAGERVSCGGPACGGYEPCGGGCADLPRSGEVCDPRLHPLCAPELVSPLGGWREVVCDPDRKVCVPVVHGGPCRVDVHCGFGGFCVDGACRVGNCIDSM